MKIDIASDIDRHLAPLQSVLETAINPEIQAQRVAKALEPFGPTGPWKYAPETERERARKAELADIDTLIGEATFAAEHSAHAADQWLTAVEAETMEPVDPVTAWQRERRQGGTLPPVEVQQLSILAELQLARFDREYGEALPSVVTAAYQQALMRPYAQASANLIRWVETRHHGEWSGRAIKGNTDEAVAAQKLKTVIGAARQARIPEDVKAARAAITSTYALVETAKRRGARSQRPAGWRVVA
jgi:hypothetical protein